MQQGTAEDPFYCASSEPTNRLEFQIQSCMTALDLDWADIDAALEGLYYAMPYDQNNHAFTFELFDIQGQPIGYGYLDTVAPGPRDTEASYAGAYGLRSNETTETLRS